jgi:hypothetical protein
MFNTDSFFEPGKLTIVMDGGAGSSGKGKLASFLGEHSKQWSFCCNAFMANAAHWVELDDGTRYMYQTLNSVAYLDSYKKLYVCGGAVIELEAAIREIKENRLNPSRLGIHPLVAVVQAKDVDYEAGMADFEGNKFPNRVQSDAMKIGSTIHGVGSARARRILRRKDVLLARDVPELHDYICDTHHEIMDRLDMGESGIMEIAQGFQLGYLHPEFYPKCLHGSSMIVMSDGSRKKIRDIVVGDIVKTRPDHGYMSEARVVNTFKGDIGQRKWVRIRTATTTSHPHNNCLIGGTYSEDHEVITNNGLTKAINLQSGDLVYVGENAITGDCLQIILGSLLGDGSICDLTKNVARAKFEKTHCDVQKEYLEAKVFILSATIGGKIRPLKAGLTSFKPGAPSHRYSSKSTHQLKQLAQSIGCLGRKTPRMFDIVGLCSAQALAIWYQDDGSWDLHHQKAKRKHRVYNYARDRVRIATNGFSIPEVHDLATALADKFRIKFSVYLSKTRQPYLQLSLKDVDSWFTLISEFIHPTMAYKVPQRHQQRCKWNFVQSSPQLALEMVLGVDVIDKERMRDSSNTYDIEVDTTHNFFVGNGEHGMINVHNCTSRNCTVAAALDDCQLPPYVAGPVLINFRTYPIRVNNNKYVDKLTDKILNAADMEKMKSEGRESDILTFAGDSGGCYPDQKEITWDEVTKTAGSDTPIVELSSLTKLPRRVYNFSRQNVVEAVRFNRTNSPTYISVNFVNYLDAKLSGVRGGVQELMDSGCRFVVSEWIENNIGYIHGAQVAFLGTGAKTDDMVQLI